MIAFPPDITFVIQIISFFALVYGLRELVFVPVMRVLDERAARTVGARAAAAATNRATDDAARAHDRKLEEMRRTLATETDAARSGVAEEERVILSAAQTEAAARLSDRRQALQAQAAEARAVLARDAESLAARMVERVVGRPAA